MSNLVNMQCKMHKLGHDTNKQDRPAKSPDLGRRLIAFYVLPVFVCLFVVVFVNESSFNIHVVHVIKHVREPLNQDIQTTLIFSHTMIGQKVWSSLIE